MKYMLVVPAFCVGLYVGQALYRVEESKGFAHIVERQAYIDSIPKVRCNPKYKQRCVYLLTKGRK